MKVHHIGYLVKRIDLAVADFERLGYEIENLAGNYGNRNSCGAVIDNIRKIRVVFMKNGDYRVELV